MKHLIKTMAFTLLGLVLSSNVWGDEVTSTFIASSPYSENMTLSTSEEDALDWVSTTAPTGIDGSGRGLQWSKVAVTLTSSINGATITKVVVNAASNSTLSDSYAITVTVGSSSFGSKAIKKDASDLEFTGSSTGTITISAPAGTKSTYIKYVKVTYTIGSCTSRTITFAGSPTTVEKTTADVPFKYAAFIDEADDQTIGYSSSDEEVATVAADGTVTIVGAGTTTITASVAATEDYCEASASYTINVTKAVFSCWSGSLNCDFTSISGFSEWGSSFSQHEVEYTGLKVTFSSANKQGSTITDCPVTKGSDVTFVAAEQKVITQIHVICKQWTDKKQTITLNYSTDGGTIYSTLTPSVTSEDFEIESTSLPEGTNAVKLTFSNSSNQIGIASACVTIEDAPTLNSINVKTAPSNVTYNAGESFDPTGLVINAVYSNGTKVIPYAGNESAFTFTPSTSTALTGDNNKVNIKYTAQDNQTANVDQEITVNLLPTTLTLTSSQNVVAGTVVANLNDWVYSVTGAPRDIEFSSDDDEIFLVDGTEGLAGDNAGQTIVTVKAVATNVYAEATEVVTVNVLSASDPKLEVNPTIVEFTNNVVGQTYTSNNIVLMGENLTANATIEISGTDAAMFTAVDGEGNAISSIEQAEGDILADIYVKYSPTAAGSHSATMTITSTTAYVEVALSGAAKASYTVQWSINGVIDDSKNETVIDGNKVTSVPSATSCDEDNIAFLGWTNNTITDAALAPTILFTDVASAPAVTEDVTYHAVFAEIGGTGEMVDKELLNVKYGDAAWSVSSSNKADKNGYTLLYTGGYVEVGSLSDWSKVTKIVVKGGTFGGSDGTITISQVAGAVTKWKDCGVVGNSETGNNEYTEGASLTGAGIVRVSSRCGSASAQNTPGVRVSQVIVYTQELDITYSHYSTTCVPPLVAPTLTEGGEFCTSVSVTISKGENPDGVTLMYSIDGGTNWTPYEGEIPVTTTTTIKAKAVMGPKESESAEATYTILKHYNDLTALKTTATENVQKACVSFSNLLVNATNVYTVYLTDGTNTYMIYKNTHGFSRGQKLSTGEHAILPYKLYNGVLQFTDNIGITAAEGTFDTPATPMAVNAITAADYGKLVKIENVIYNDGVFTDASSNTIKLGSNIVNASSWLTNGAIYDITGIITTPMIDDVPTLTISPRVKDLDVVSKAEKLNAPSNLRYENLTGSSVTLKWDEVTGAAKYDVEVYDGTTRVKNNQTTSLSYGPTGLASGKTYTWRVRSVGDDLTTATSEWTDGTATFTTPAPATLYWIVNGDMEHPFATTTAASEKVVMPTTDPISACDENYEDFICWVLEPIEGVRTEKIYNNMRVSASTDAKSADGDKYFYAAFGKVETEGSEAYVKVVADQEDWTGDYLIGKETSGTIFDGSRPRTGEALDDTENTQSITIPEDGTITNVDDVKAYQFSIAKSSTTKDDDGADAVYYTIKSAQNYYIGGKNNDNGMNSNSSFSTKTYDNIITWLTENNRVQISSYYGNTYLTFNNTANQQRFRYMKNEDKTITLYKRVTTPTTYSAYITTCPTFYNITIDPTIVGGEVTAEPNTTIDAGTTIQLTADASAGYTATDGTWTVTNEATSETITVSNSNQFTMPASNVTVSYAFVALVDNFQDALHGAAAQTGEGAQYDLPSLANTTEGTRKDAFFKFAGWVPATTEITTGEPATEKPTILEGKQNATGATYKALWANAAETAFITEECGTDIPTNLHVVNDALTANSAKLDWNNVTGATKYHVSVYQATDLVVEADVTSSEYVATGLTAATEYTFTVKAFKGCWGYEADAVSFTTKAEAVPHAVTLVAENGQIEIDPALTEGKLLEGTVATVTATADEGYYFVSWNFTNVTPTSVNENVATFAMPTKAITITATFAEIPKVTWKMEGATDVVTFSVRNGDKFEVGTVQSAPENWKGKSSYKEFAGWVTSEKCDAEGNVETAEFVSATTEVSATGLTVYGAVAKSSAPDCSQATKITSNENLDMSAVYVMGVEYDSKTQYFYNLNNKWAKISDDYTSNTPYMFTISGNADALAILSKNGYIKGQSSDFAFNATETTIVLTATGLMQYSTATETYQLAYNHNSGNGGIRWYKVSSISSSSYPLAYLYKVGLAYENLTINPQPDYGRTDLVVGNYGTVCVPYTVTAADRQGATFWSIETSNAPGSTNPTLITIVEETGDLVAGKPYIFCATEPTMSLSYSGEEYTGTESVEANGLYGNLTDATITINDSSDPNAGSEPTRGYFFVLQQKLYECGWNCTVDPNRGWVKATDITDQTPTTPVTAPRRVIGNPNVAPTRIDNLNGEGWVEMIGAHKYFRNGTIMIVNDGHIYNAQGIKIQ